jgi:hypothetical protein
MTPNELKRHFPNATKSFIDKNSTPSSRESKESEQVDKQRTGEACGSEKMGAQYSLRHCEVEFYASHGKVLDQDNRRYIPKVILDALVHLGFACDDKDITSETTQRMDKADINI